MGFEHASILIFTCSTVISAHNAIFTNSIGIHKYWTAFSCIGSTYQLVHICYLLLANFCCPVQNVHEHTNIKPFNRSQRLVKASCEEVSKCTHHITYISFEVLSDTVT